MAVVPNKRSIMIMYSNPVCPYSHQVRIVLAEKGVAVDILNTNPNEHPEELMELNPYGCVPTLIDRELVLYEARIIMEYLDERFPHPPLMPVYPVARAEARRTMLRIEKDWYSLMTQIFIGNETQKTEARKQLRNSLIATVPAFAEKPYFLNEDLTIVDAAIIPLLWRLPVMGIELPAKAKPIRDYIDLVAKRDAFQVSLSEQEREIWPEKVQ